MPAIKKLVDRAMMQPPPPEPVPFSKLEDFDWNQTMYQTYVIPKPLFEKLEQIPDSGSVNNVNPKLSPQEKFICQCLLDLINDSRGLERQEPTKPREAWYSYTKKIPTQRLFKFEHHDDKVRPYYEVTVEQTRKRIPFDDDKQVVFFEPTQHDQRQASNFQVPVRLWNECFRLTEYFQMTVYDSFLQAVERGLFKHEQQKPQPVNPHATRYKRFSDREQQRENRLIETVTKRVAKNHPSGGEA